MFKWSFTAIQTKSNRKKPLEYTYTRTHIHRDLHGKINIEPNEKKTDWKARYNTSKYTYRISTANVTSQYDKIKWNYNAYGSRRRRPNQREIESEWQRGRGREKKTENWNNIPLASNESIISSSNIHSMAFFVSMGSMIQTGFMYGSFNMYVILLDSRNHFHSRDCFVCGI